MASCFLWLKGRRNRHLCSERSSCTVQEQDQRGHTHVSCLANDNCKLPNDIMINMCSESSTVQDQKGHAHDSCLATNNCKLPNDIMIDMCSERSTVQDQKGHAHVSCLANGDICKLPNDIMINILSRLAPDSVFVCRAVCWQWYQLITSPHFVESHLNRAPETLANFIVWDTCKNKTELDIFLVENIGMKAKIRKVIPMAMSCAKKEREAPMIMRGGLLQREDSPHYVGYCNYNGLLLFQFGFQQYVLYNPVTGKEADLCLPGGGICGFFFDPLTKDYKFLQHCLADYQTQYSVYHLKTKTLKKLSTSNYFPSGFHSPVRLPRAFFWIVYLLQRRFHLSHQCSKNIMMFSLDREKFSLLPHPDGACYSYATRWHTTIRLLEMDNSLSYTHVNMNEIGIWVLEDHVNFRWLKKYVVKVEEYWSDFFRCPFLDEQVHVLNIFNGELLLYWRPRGLVWYDLRSTRFRKSMTGSEISGKVLLLPNPPLSWSNLKNLIALRQFV